MPTVTRRIRRTLPAAQGGQPQPTQPTFAGGGGGEPLDDGDGPGQNLRNRFRPLARARMQAALAALDYLGQLAVRARYHYSDDEAQAILDALGQKLEELVQAFSRGTGNKPTFLFPDEVPGGPKGGS